MSGSLDPLSMLSAGAQGKYTGPAGTPPGAPALMPPELNPPTAPATPDPADSVPPIDPMAALAAGAKGTFRPTTPTGYQGAENQWLQTQQPAATQGATGNIFRRMRASPDMMNNPSSDVAAEALGSIANGAAALPEMASNAAIRGLNKLFGSNIQQMQPPIAMGAPTEGDRLVQAGGQAVGSVLPMAMGGAAMEGAEALGPVAQGVGKAMSNIPVSALPAVAAGGVTGQGAADALPPDSPYKNLINTAGNLLGAGAAATLAAGAPTVLGIASKLGQGAAVGRLGPSQTYGEGLPAGVEPIKATSSQAKYAVDVLQKEGGPQLQQDLAKNPMQATHDALEDQLQQGPNPAVQKQLDDLKLAMAARGSQFENVPGQSPTTAQVSPSPGMMKLEKASMADPTSRFGRSAFQTQQMLANQAAIKHIETLNPGVTSKFGDAFVERATELAQQQEQAATQGKQAVSEATTPLTSRLNEDQSQITGNAMREAAAAGDVAGRQQNTDQFWSQVPRNLTHTVMPAKEMAAVFLGEHPLPLPPANADPAALQAAQKVNDFIIRPDLADLANSQRPQEIQTLHAIAALPDAMPYRDTATLLRNLAATKADLVRSGAGQSPSMVRLRMIEGSLQDSMSGDAQQRMLSGELPLVPANAGGPEDAGALNAARAASKQHFQQYNQGVVGDVLQGGSNYEPYRIGYLADVAKRVFNGGASEPERVGQMLDVLRTAPGAQQEMENYLINDAARKGVLAPTGELDPSKYSKWMSGPRLQTVKQFPELYKTFQNANAVQQRVDEANGAATLARTNYENGVARSILKGQDPALAVRAALGMQDRGATLSQYVDAVKNNPAAMSSLQGHVISEVMDKFAPSSKAANGMESAQLASQKFRDFVDNFKRPLVQLYGGQGIQRFYQVQAALRDAQLPQDPLKGSHTTPLAQIVGASEGHGQHATGLSGIGALVGEHLSESFGKHGVLGLGIGALVPRLTSAFRAAGFATRKDLINAMVRYPDFLKAMIEKYPVGSKTNSVMGAKVSAALRGVVASQMGAGAQPPNLGQ